jgi:hypothetical protein
MTNNRPKHDEELQKAEEDLKAVNRILDGIQSNQAREEYINRLTPLLEEIRTKLQQA